MDEGNPFVYMIQSIFRETPVDPMVDPTPKRIQHLLDFLNYVVRNGLQSHVTLSLSICAQEHPGFAKLLNLVFVLLRQGFIRDNAFKVIRSFVRDMNIELLTEFLHSLSREELIQLLDYTLREDIRTWYTYLFEHYVKPSEIPSIRRDNGRVDYPEYLERIPSLFLFKDLDFITYNRVLINKAFIELLKTTKVSGTPYDNYKEQLTDLNMDVLINHSFDNFSYEDVMRSENIVLYRGVYMPRTDLDQRRPVLNVNENTEKHQMALALNFINKFFGDELRQGTSREPGMIKMKEFIQSNRLRSMERDTSNAILSAGILKLESIVQELIPYFNEYDSRLGKAFMTDMKNTMDNYISYLAEVDGNAEDKTGIKLRVSYQLIDFYYNLVNDWILKVENEDIQNEMLRYLSEQTIKSLPETIMESFIGEDVLLREKSLVQPFPIIPDIDFYAIKEELNPTPKVRKIMSSSEKIAHLEKKIKKLEKKNEKENRSKISKLKRKLNKLQKEEEESNELDDDEIAYVIRSLEKERSELLRRLERDEDNDEIRDALYEININIGELRIRRNREMKDDTSSLSEMESYEEEEVDTNLTAIEQEILDLEEMEINLRRQIEENDEDMD